MSVRWSGRLLALGLCLLIPACSNPERDRIRATTQASYDRATGKLAEITYDRNKNGRIDTWTKMDGNRPVSSQIDTDEDGTIDRWEEYGPDGKLTVVRWERPKPPTAADRTMKGRPDATAYIDVDGSVKRIEYTEVSELTGKESVVRREFYQGGKLVRAEEDTLGQNYLDRFETYDATGRLASVEFDETGDGKPDRRVTYGDANRIVLIETESDGSGGYLKKTVPTAKK